MAFKTRQLYGRTELAIDPIRYKKKHMPNGKVEWWFDFRDIRSYPTPINNRVAGIKPKITDPEEARIRIEEYFQSCIGPLVHPKTGEIVTDKDGNVVYTQIKPYTFSGLAKSLGLFTTSYNYYCSGQYDNPAEDNPDNWLSTILLSAKQRVEEYAESRLYDKDGQRGAQYVLSSVFDWATHKERSDDKNSEFTRWRQYKELEMKAELLDGGEDDSVEIRIVRKGLDK